MVDARETGAHQSSPTEVFYEDDQQKPDVGRQIVDKFIETHKVDVIVGVPWSNVMMAIYAPVTRSKTFLISSNAGPSPIAGEQCSKYFFSTSWQGDNFAEAMGAHMSAKGLRTQNRPVAAQAAPEDQANPSCARARATPGRCFMRVKCPARLAGSSSFMRMTRQNSM
jgi:hypothetical protein